MKPVPANRAGRLLRGAVLVGVLALAVVALALTRSADTEPLVNGKTTAAWLAALQVAETAPEAVKALTEVGPRAYPGLGRLLAEPSYNVRWRALCLLRDIPGDAVSARDDVSRALAATPEPAEAGILLALVERMGPAGASLAPRVAVFLTHAEAVVRRAAWRTLVATGGPADVLLPQITRALEADDDPTDALRCLEALGEDALPAVPDLERWLLALPAPKVEEPLGQAESAAFRVLAGLGGTQPRARAVLQRLVVEAGPRLADPAVRTVMSLADRDPARVEDLLAVLRAPDGSVRVAVLEALTADRNRAKAMLPTLLELLADSRPTVRALGLATIGRLGRDAAGVLPALLDLLVLKGSDPGVRRAIEGIGAEDPAALAEALPLLPHEGLDDLVAIAQALLGRLPPEARGPVWARLTGWWLAGATSPTPGGEESLAILLAGLGAREPQVLDPLVPALGSEDEPRRLRAAQLLGRLPGKRALLLERLASPDARQRQAALAGLAHGQAQDAKQERLLVLAALADPAPEVRAEAVVRLLGTPAADGNPLSDLGAEQRKTVISILTGMLGGASPARRRFAAGALRLFPESSPEAVAALGAALASEDEDLRRLALLTLQSTQHSLEAAAEPIVALFSRATEPPDTFTLLPLLTRAGPAARGAAEHLVSLYAKGDANFRRQLLPVLGAIDPPAEMVLPSIRAALADKDQNLQQSALACVTTLARNLGVLAPELLRMHVEDPVQGSGRPQHVRDQLARTVAALGASPEAHAAVLVQVRGAAPSERELLVDALGPLAKQHEGWLEPLIALLRDEDESTRRAAAAALLVSGRPVREGAAELLAAVESLPLAQIEPVVERLTGSPASPRDVVPMLIRVHRKHPASQALVVALRRLGSQAPRALVDGLADATPEDKALLRELLAEANVNSLPPDEGGAVAGALCAWIDEQTIPASQAGRVADLLRFLSEVRQAPCLPRPESVIHLFQICPEEGVPRVLDLLGRVGPAAAAATPLLLERFDGFGIQAKMAALDAMGKIASPIEQVRPLLHAAILGNDSRLRQAALNAWTSLGQSMAGFVPDFLRLVGRPTEETAQQGGPARQLAELRRLRLLIGPAPGAGAAVVADLATAKPEDREALARGLTVVANHHELWHTFLMELILDPDPKARALALDAARGASRDLSDTGAVLANALEKVPIEQASEALALLAARGTSSKGPVPALLRLHRLHPDNPGVRAALLRTGTQDLDAVAESLAGALREQRLVLLQVLGNSNLSTLGPASAAAISNAVCGWIEEGTLPRQSLEIALRVLSGAQANPERAFKVLFALLGDEQMAHVAGFAISRLPGSSEALLARMSSPEAAHRLQALHVLASFGSRLTPDEEVVFGNALEDTDADVRAEAALALLRQRWAHADGSQGKPARMLSALGRVLVELLRSPVPRRSGVALDALHWLDAKGPATISALLEVWREGKPDLDVGTVAVLIHKHMRPEDRDTVVAHARKELSATSPRSRGVALYLLGVVGEPRPEALQMLPTLLTDPSPQVRATALGVASSMGVEAASLEAALIERVQNDSDPLVSQTAPLALARVAPESPAAFAALRAALLDRTSTFASNVALAMALYGARAVPAFQEGLAREEPVLTASVVGLTQLGPTARDALPALEALQARRPQDVTIRYAIAAIRGEERK